MKTIYTDGSCINNPGKGAWAWILVDQDQIIQQESQQVADTTNNRMEMMAAIKAIQTNEGNLEIYTDSIYLKNGITIWIYSWLKSNWKNNTIKNIDLWKELFTLTQNRNIQWNWIKAHNNNRYNDAVDKLANETAHL